MSKLMNMLTEKQKAIMVLLGDNIDMPTADIIDEVKSVYNLNVSKRYVQKVRKKFKSEIKKINKKKGNDMEKQDVFDTDYSEEQDYPTMKGLYANLTVHEKKIIDMANEGDKTVQQIASTLGYSIVFVRNTMESFEKLIYCKIIEEDSPVVEDSDKDVNNFSYKLNQREPDFFEVEIDCIESCSKVKNNIDVLIDEITVRKAMMYMKWAGAREWLGYLVGSFNGKEYIVNDIYLPDQRTCSTLVDKVDASKYNEMNIIGVIHSHHEMGAGDEDRPSFSGHDENFINGNHNISLLAGRDRNTKGFKIVGIARVKTPCDGLMKVKANVKKIPYEFFTEEEIKNIKNEFFDKTQKQTQTQTRIMGNVRITRKGDTTTYHYGNHGGWPMNEWRKKLIEDEGGDD